MVAKYFTQVAHKEKSSYIDGSYIHDFVPCVSEHVATDTGLVDKNGNAIMRMPNPMGFIWDG